MWGGICALGLLVSAPSSAQPDDPKKPPGANAAKITKNIDPPGVGTTSRDDSDKADDAFQPKGFEVGQFLFLPRLEADNTYNSNIFTNGGPDKPDYIFHLVPELKIRSRFASHELNFEARVEPFVHAKYRDDDHVDVFLQSDGRYDIDKTWEATGFILLSQNAADRGSPDNANGKTPGIDNSVNSRFGTKLKTGRFTINGSTAITRREFGDVETDTGTKIANHLRDRTQIEVVGQGAYEIFPGYDAVVRATGDLRRYDSTFDISGFNRTSDGFRLEGGAAIDISQVIRGDFVIGYLQQSYADPRLRTPKGLSFKSSLNWTPSRMTIVVPSLERVVTESTQVGVAALATTNVGLTVRHELQRNIILFGGFTAAFDDYQGSSQQGEYYTVTGRITYNFSRELYAAGEVEYRTRNYKLAGLPSYQQTVSSLRIGVRY
jgi:hypothetical protein